MTLGASARAVIVQALTQLLDGEHRLRAVDHAVAVRADNGEVVDCGRALASRDRIGVMALDETVAEFPVALGEVHVADLASEPFRLPLDGGLLSPDYRSVTFGDAMLPKDEPSLDPTFFVFLGRQQIDLAVGDRSDPRDGLRESVGVVDEVCPHLVNARTALRRL